MGIFLEPHSIGFVDFVVFGENPVVLFKCVDHLSTLGIGFEIHVTRLKSIATLNTKNMHFVGFLTKSVDFSSNSDNEMVFTSLKGLFQPNDVLAQLRHNLKH